METPSSTRRITRSQVASLNNSSNNIPIPRKGEESDKALSKLRQVNRKQQDLSAMKTQQDRSALIDITNDSPIVGLAMGSSETPLSSIVKQRSSHVKKTPGSGEALLRGQVKTLLQKVEEEAELSKLSLETRPFLHRLQGSLVNSPCLAPTPANTPQVSSLSGDGSVSSNDISSVAPSQIVEEQLISQVINDIFDGKKQEESTESEKNLITARSLLLDFSEKSEISDASECCSVLTHQEKSLSRDDDDASSIWSIQVSASTNDEEEDELIEEEEDEEEDEEEEEEEDEGGLVEELCEGMSEISMNEERKAVMFAGKHTRFVYNSDDELVEEICGEEGNFSPSVMRLKGLPTPKGKHMRFPLEDED